MKKSFLFLGILAALSLVAAESPADTEAKINNPVEKLAVPGSEGSGDNFYANGQTLQGEKFEFQTEVSRLMNIVINSLYKTPEIFLRELISNGSDALDKIRFQSLTNPSVLDSNPSLNVTIAVHKKERVITISDSGIGMTKQDLQKNLGTIAKSGTSEFIEALQEDNNNVDLIGKFGVGFYSVFLVADKVRVTSKHNDDDQYIWESTAVNDFTIAKDPRGNTLGRGTQIAIYLKPGQDQYLDDKRLGSLVEKYSEFISFPIYVRREKTKTIEVPVEAPEKKASEEESEDPTVETEEEDKAKTEAKTKKEKVTFLEDDLVNSNKPIWMRHHTEVTPEEYTQFYSVIAKDPKAVPMAYSHFQAAADVDFRAIIYIPKTAPKDMFKRPDVGSRNVKLYVKRVFITDDSQDLLPRWLSFVKVVVDADDAPLNVSRETVQSSKSIRSIGKHLVKKVFDLLRSMAKDEEKYAAFIKEFGANLKLGALEDRFNKPKIAKLLRFKTSNSADGNGLTSLADYVARMKKGQKDIYYFTGLNAAEIKQSPFVEALLARGYEVLFMDEPADEILVNALQNFDNFGFQNAGKADLKLGEDDEAAKQALEEEYAPVVDWIQTTLAKDIEKVQLSSRLTTSPAALVASTYGWTANMEKIMDASSKQQQEQGMNAFFRSQKKILEINPGHPLIKGMLARAKEDPKDGLEQDLQFKEMARMLYEITVIRSGYSLKDGVKDFAVRVENMMRDNLGIDLKAQAVFEAPEAESRPQDEIEEAIKKRKEQDEMEEKLEALPEDEDDEEGMSPEELNRLIKEITDDVPAKPGHVGEPEVVRKVLDVEDTIAETEKELDSEDSEPAADAQKNTAHDEL